jgi:L-iditol 2-dehydrogenase
MSQRRFDATLVHTHSFAFEDLPTALRYARDRVEDAIKLVVRTRGIALQRAAAE